MKRLLLIALLTMAFSVNAATTVSFFLDNVWIDTTGDPDDQQMTGTFDWTYTEGEFADGSGTFTELYIPHYGADLSGVTTSIEPKSLEFSHKTEVHNIDINVMLNLDPPGFTLAGGDLLLGSGSVFDVNTITGTFVSGRITPTVVPVPAAFWLFGAGLVGLVGVARRKS